MLSGQECLHHGGVDHRAAAAHGAEGHSSLADENSYPISGFISQPYWIHHEHSSKTNCETGVEAKDVVGGFH